MAKIRDQKAPRRAAGHRYRNARKAVLARLAATALAAYLQHRCHIAPIGDPIAQIKLGHLLQQLGFTQQSSSRQALPRRLNDQGKPLHALLNAH